MTNLKLKEAWPQILCFYPFYNTDGSNSTWVLLQNGGKYADRRKTKTVLQAVAKIFAADLTALRHNYRDFLGCRGMVPLPLHKNFILVPFRVRRVQYKDHGATGYAVLDKVQSVKPAAPENVNHGMSRIGFTGGIAVECIEKTDTIKKRLAEAAQVRKEYYRFYGGRKVPPFPDVIRDPFAGEGQEKIIYHIHFNGGKLTDIVPAKLSDITGSQGG